MRQFAINVALWFMALLLEFGRWIDEQDLDDDDEELQQLTVSQ